MPTYEELKPILRTLAKENFWAFCCYYDYEFFRINRPFLKEIAIAFQFVIDEYKAGRAVKISVSMPPRAGKSYITSLFCAYWLCTFPELSVMRNTCTQKLYEKLSYDTRAIFRNQKLRDVFPEAHLSRDKQNVGGWNLETAKQVSYFGAGVGGTIIGFGANIAITDDLYKDMLSALSSTVQEKTNSWKESAHDSRMEKNCPEIFIGTRWTNDDVIGKAISSGDLAIVIRVPALIEKDGEFVSFCEEVKTTAEYSKIKSRIDASIWNAEYMQEPVEAEGLLLPKSSLRFANMKNIPDELEDFRFGVLDTADTGGDKFSCPFFTVVVDGDTFAVYVRKTIHNKHGVEANTPKVLEFCASENTEKLFVEKNGNGLASYVLLRNNKPTDLHTEILSFVSTIDKTVRILSNYEFIKRYFVFDEDYENDKEYSDFIKDLTGFLKEGDNTHKKDAIDICSSAARLLKVKYKNLLYGKCA